MCSVWGTFQVEISDSAESLQQVANIASETQKVAREVKRYTEEDIFGQKGKIHDLYISLKEQILQMYPDLVINPKKIYVGFQVPDNWRNIFHISKTRDELVVSFMRSVPKDFDDPKKKLKLFNKSREYWGQDISFLSIKDEKDISYAMILVQQAKERFVKDFEK